MISTQAAARAEITPAPDTEKIRTLNDTFRRDLYNSTLGTLILTAGVGVLSNTDRFALLDEVRCFEDFTLANDPYGEHDFGAINFHGEKYFWKIDYYNQALHAHSPNPANAKLTHRVLTIMRADEY